MDRFLALLLTVMIAAAVAACLCVLLRPLLLRYALARPNARSSHRIPTPQGGGIAVLAGAFAALGLGLVVWPLPDAPRDGLILVAAAAILLAVVGAWDDIRPLPASLRLGFQAASVAIVLIHVAPGLRLFPEWMPLAVERLVALLAGVWFVNLVNFMDGIDWITIAGIVPLTGALALAGPLDPGSAMLAAALCGGLIGFAPFNKPVARLFLGDVGSLPIGLLTAYLLYRLAGTGALAAALILPLYHIADATLTLLRRLARGERIWEAHRSHLYQQATANGFSVLSVVTGIAVLNLGLVVLAGISIHFPASWVQVGCLVAAALPTALLMRTFSRRRAGLG